MSSNPQIDMQPNANQIPTPTSKNPKAEKLLNVLLIVALAVFILVLTVKGFFVSNVLVQQSSMTPTLQDGQTVWVSKVNKVNRGDIVVFFTQDVQAKFIAGFLGSSEKYVKRVVAVEGDQIWVEEDANGNYVFKVLTGDTNQILAEDYYTYKGNSVVIPVTLAINLGDMQNHIGQANALTIPQDTMFVLGDNRNNSTDSRTLGAVPSSRLFGVLI